MKKGPMIIVASGLLIVVVALLAFRQSEGAAANTLVVYKSASCGCCAKWIEHVEAAGFEVEVHDVTNLPTIKAEHGIATNLQSCHTAIIDGYVIEGHVPAEHIVSLLAERPDMKGLAVPGMPLGSPGMEVPNPMDAQDFNVMAFDAEGRTAVYARVERGS